MLAPVMTIRAEFKEKERMREQRLEEQIDRLWQEVDQVSPR